MNNEIQNLNLETFISAEEISFSPLENDLAERFEISVEELRKLLFEAENVDDLISKLNSLKEG